ncbi:MAG: IPT/TIG domain-containing protein [Dehalococcoidales bacterium]|nr:IPT/TIG domain-containing protein [Dehalococcoidales bacterium]
MTIKNNHKIAAGIIAAFIFSISAVSSLSADSLAFWSVMDSGTTTDLNAVWGSDSANIFAVGKSGAILHYDGTLWTPVTSATTADLNAVWGSDSANIFAVGKSGAILHYNGTLWTPVTSGTTAGLNAVWGSDSANIFAVGKSGAILHYNGTLWTPMTSGTTADLNAVWGSSSTHVFAAGQSGTILCYDGTSWSAVTSGSTVDLYGLWGSSSTDIFAVGQSGTILRYDGTSWSVVNSGITADLYGIWGADNTHVFAAGQMGVILNYDGSGFSSMDRNTASDLRSVWGSSYSNVFIAGYSGTILIYSPPVIYTILPNEGYQGATLNVTVTGANFSGASALQFGVGISVNSFTVVSSNRIDANITITPGTATGGRNVTVTTPGGSFTYPDSFTVKQALPVITSVEPNQGRQGETLNITITGSNFTVVSAIQFGSGISVNSFTILSSNQISTNITISSDAVTGLRDVSVTIPGSSYTFSGGFTVKQSLPLITFVEPNQERQGTTLNVTITGANFTDTSAIQFGAGISVNSFTVIAADQITVNITISSGAATGSRNVTVTTPGGSYTLPNGFTVKQALPVITSIEPNQGRQEETLNITITGASFTGTSVVQLGAGISVNSFNVLSSNQISANITVAAGAATGTRDVSVTTPGGSFKLPDSFTVKQALPVITSISPANGNRGTTLAVTINGNNLSGATSVGFGDGIEVTGFTGISPMQLLVNVIISSEAVTGSRDITVTTSGGGFTLPGSFIIKQELPLITSISPDSGNQGATLNITISGANFTGASEVQFGSGISVNSFNVLSSNQISANITVVTGAAAGTRDASVTTPGGSFVFHGGFTVKQSLPVITSVNPARGNPGTTMVVIINGNNMAGTTSVGFGDGIEVTGFTNISPTQLRVNVTINSDAIIGSRDITITTPGGSTTFGQGFNIEVKSQNTVALISIWTGIAVVFILLTVILNILRRKKAARL